MDKLRYLPLILVVTALGASPAAAQDYDGSVGYGAGGIWFSDFNAGSGGTPLTMDPGWVTAAHIENWVDRGRFGGRINVAFTQRPLDTTVDQRDISSWLVGGDLLLRMLSPSPGRSVAPFIGAGVGFASYGLGRGQPVAFPDERAQYSGEDSRRFTVSGAFGFDILPSFTIFGTPSGFRLEIIDHMALDSPFTRVPSGSFDPVHNIRVTLSLLGMVRLAR
jgi:hypothetical protein